MGLELVVCVYVGRYLVGGVYRWALGITVLKLRLGFLREVAGGHCTWMWMWICIYVLAIC